MQSEELELLPESTFAYLCAEADRGIAENRLDLYQPYAKQREFHDLAMRERLLMAGNQLGKTWAGAFEMAMHLTGRYPDWWTGRGL